MFDIIVKSLAGFEDVLAKEMVELGAQEVEPLRRAVRCKGDKQMLYKLNFNLRTALKVLVPFKEFEADNADAVYQVARTVKWEQYLDINQSFAIDSVVFSDNFNHSKFVSYRVKDAIADYFVKKYDKRPSVSLSKPDVRVNIHIAGTHCTLSIDSSGESLHKRGWRVGQTEAPLSEVLAAGILLKTGWDGKSDLYDPMCGSGTFLVEAAMIARDIPPGLYRKEFAFERWQDFDADLYDEVYNEKEDERDFDFKIYGSDISGMALRVAEANLKNAGLSKFVVLEESPFQKVAPKGEGGMLVMNPPYGQRLQPRDLEALYGSIGERMKHHFTGFEAWILGYPKEAMQNIGLRAGERMKLKNGDLDCFLNQYQLYQGSKKASKNE